MLSSLTSVRFDVYYETLLCQGFPGGTMVKNWPANAGNARDMGSIPGLGRSPGEGNGNPLHCSSLEIPWTEEPGTVHGLQRVRDN